MGRLEIIEVSKRLGGVLVLDNVSFTVEDGEFFTLLGPSGSGKSTLLRLIAGLEAPDTGQIVLDGRDITRLPSRERNLGMVFQDYGLYPGMNVFQNIAYGLEARGVKKSLINELVPQAAEQLGLGGMLNKNINDLSGGEQQRVALARAIVKDADAYLYDEPLSNLDPKLRHKARTDITRVHRAKRKPSLYITHDQDEAFSMGDRIGVIARAKLQQVGHTDAILKCPRNTFVAGFVGSPPANLIEGRLLRQESGFALRCADWTVHLDADWTPILSAYQHETIILGVRPGAITLLDNDAGAAGAVEYAARVSTLQALLGETLVDLDLGDNLHLTALISDDVEFVEGAEKRFTLDPEGVFLFDGQTELNLRA